MKKKTLIILLTLTILLIGYLIFTERKYESGDLRPVFQEKDIFIEKIKYEYKGNTQNAKEKNFELIRKDTTPFHKEHFYAEFIEPLSFKSSEVRVIRFLLSPMVRVYFTELENLNAFEETKDEENLHVSLGFSPCRERIIFYRKNSETNEEICLGEKTYNEARRYVLLPGKKIILTYAHIWQRYQNPLFSLAEMQVIPPHYLYNYAELKFIDKSFPLLQEKTLGKLVIVPKKTTLGQEKKETIVWEFSPKEVLPEPYSERLMSTLMSLRFKTLLRLDERLKKLKPILELQIWQKEVSGKERELAKWLFFPEKEAKGQWQAISGEKVQILPQELLVFSSESFGIISKEEQQRFFSIFREIEITLKKNLDK